MRPFQFAHDLIDLPAHGLVFATQIVRRAKQPAQQRHLGDGAHVIAVKHHKHLTQQIAAVTGILGPGLFHDFVGETGSRAAHVLAVTVLQARLQQIDLRRFLVDRLLFLDADRLQLRFNLFTHGVECFQCDRIDRGRCAGARLCEVGKGDLL